MLSPDEFIEALHREGIDARLEDLAGSPGYPDWITGHFKVTKRGWFIAPQEDVDVEIWQYDIPMNFPVMLSCMLAAPETIGTFPPDGLEFNEDVPGEAFFASIPASKALELVKLHNIASKCIKCKRFIWQLDGPWAEITGVTECPDGGTHEEKR